MKEKEVSNNQIGEFILDRVYEGDCAQLIEQLPNESIDIVVTSPPYWGHDCQAALV